MTTPTETLVHGAGPGPSATHCGLPFTADLRLSAKRSLVTCPACLTAMGEPRVVSGTDAVAATPEPLPAPAPRVSRAVQMARNLFDGPGAKWVGPDEMEQYFAAVARETFACIKHFGGDLDRARAAMLEPR